MSNVFPLIETKGVQLVVILHTFERKGMLMDWIDFFRQSLYHGWKPTNTLSKIHEALSEVKGKEHSTGVIEQLKMLMNQ